jgi:cell division protein ZapA (FtsZ GTPase activity inhibitor)
MNAGPVHIRIRGKEFRLRATECTDTEQDIEQAARYVDEIVAKLDPGEELPEDKLYFLTAINLALDLAKERRTRSCDRERISSLVRRVEQCL